jgi:hypothetical protein
MQFNGPGTVGNFPNSPASDTQVRILLQNIPEGLDISGCSATFTNGEATSVTSGVPTLDYFNIPAASPILTVNFASVLDLDNLDVLWIKCTTVGPGSATLPLPSTTVTARVTLGPTGAALSVPGLPLTGLTTGQVPRYQNDLLPLIPMTLVEFAQAPPATRRMRQITSQ